MADQQVGGQGSSPGSSIIARVTRIALVCNAVAAGIAATGFASGFAPHALEHPLLARRVAASEVAGAFIFAFVAWRLRRDARLIALPMVFVFFNLVVSVYEFLATGGPNDLPPAIVEGFFLSIYTVYAATQLPVHTRAQYTA